MHDDHELHLDYHTDFIKSEEGQKLDDTTFIELDTHIADHWMKFQEEIQARMQAQMLSGQGQGGVQTEEERMAGTPGPEPGAPGAEGIQ